METTSIIKRFTVVGIAVPVSLTGIAVATQLILLPSTPDPIAMHWGVNGVDGSGPGWFYPLITLLMGAGVPVWLGLSARPRLVAGSRGWSFRFLAAFALGFAVFASIAMTWTVAMQVGLESWTDAPDVGPVILAATALGIAAGAIGYAVQPKTLTVYEQRPVVHVDLAPGERAVWLGVAKASKGAVIAITIAVVVLVVGAVVAWVVTAFAGVWVLVGVALLVAILGLTTMEADVRVDGSGVEVRGPAGWPRSHIALADIASAQAITVDPLGSFGGWGWRRVPGAMGVVLRSGEALRVERKEGHALVVTVDDAATAAALATALAARQEA